MLIKLWQCRHLRHAYIVMLSVCVRMIFIHLLVLFMVSYTEYDMETTSLSGPCVPRSATIHGRQRQLLQGVLEYVTIVIPVIPTNCNSCVVLLVLLLLLGLSKTTTTMRMMMMYLVTFSKFRVASRTSAQFNKVRRMKRSHQQCQ